MNDDELITTVRESFTGVHSATPVDQIVQRSRAVRARRFFPGVAAAAAVAAGAALAVSMLTPASHQSTAQLAAWTVARQADGTVSITIRQFRDPAGLQRELRADGVPASVIFNPRLPAGAPFRDLFHVKNNPCQAYSGGQGQLLKVVRVGVRTRSGNDPPSRSSIPRLCPAALASSSSPPPTPATRIAARSASRSGSSWCKPASSAPVAEPARRMTGRAGHCGRGAQRKRQMATSVPAAPQAASTARLCQLTPVCSANGPSSAWLNGRTGSMLATWFSAREWIGR